MSSFYEWEGSPREKQECLVCKAKRKLKRCERCSKLICFLHADFTNHLCNKPIATKPLSV